MKCPNCAAEATGKFCSNCGGALAGATCASCHAGLTAGARFCHACGTPVAGRRVASGLMPWIVAGGAVVTLIVVAIARLAPTAPAGGATQGAPVPVQAPDAGAAAGGGAPDISSMTPRERADRLFDRIMTAGEQGDTARMRFFRPMALQAYAMLGAPDDHIRYDVGMIYAVLGEADSALAQAASIERNTPNNLLAIMVRIAVATGHKDQATVRRLYTRYLAAYDREIATKRPGYDEHRGALDAMRDEARRVAGGGALKGP
ncbi:MAG TPA: zinc ribbon domain-containing protein [Gemmatimonadales bacterium]